MTEEQDPVDKPALLHREEPTPTDLVELTRKLFEAGDRGGVDTMVSVLAPDAVLEADALDMRFEGVAWDGGMLGRVSAHGDLDEARAAAERLAQERG